MFLIIRSFSTAPKALCFMYLALQVLASVQAGGLEHTPVENQNYRIKG